jgi:uncharacterized protein YukE
MSEVTVTSTEFAAHKADIDERIENIVTQLAILDGKITDLQTSTTVEDFPDEEEQIREKVLEAFADEIASLVADINKLKSDMVTVQKQLGII